MFCTHVTLLTHPRTPTAAAMAHNKETRLLAVNVGPLPYLTFGVSYTLSAEATIMGPMRIPDVPFG